MAWRNEFLERAWKEKSLQKFPVTSVWLSAWMQTTLAAKETAWELMPQATQVGRGEGEGEHFNLNFRHNHFFKEQLERKT